MMGLIIAFVLTLALGFFWIRSLLLGKFDSDPDAEPVPDEKMHQDRHDYPHD